jgi:hypothetical protein
LPQVGTLDAVVEKLRARPDVRLIWLGGSFATGKADRYSDVDLRIAVDPDAFENWFTIDLKTLFDDDCPGCITMPDPGKSVLHHVLLGNGELFDVYVQPFPPAFVEVNIVPLAMSEGLNYELPTPTRSESPTEQKVSGKELEQTLRTFWINTHKHRKVLDRGLDLMAHIGLRFDQDVLRRLWLSNLAGRDEQRLQTIHTMTDQIRTISDGVGQHACDVLGMPLQCRAELIAAIEATRNEVSVVGRELAANYNFEYPEDAERVALSGWAEFLGRKSTEQLSW